MFIRQVGVANIGRRWYRREISTGKYSIFATIDTYEGGISPTRRCATFWARILRFLVGSASVSMKSRRLHSSSLRADKRWIATRARIREGSKPDHTHGKQSWSSPRLGLSISTEIYPVFATMDTFRGVDIPRRKLFTWKVESWQTAPEPTSGTHLLEIEIKIVLESGITNASEIEIRPEHHCAFQICHNFELATGLQFELDFAPKFDLRYELKSEM